MYSLVAGFGYLGDDDRADEWFSHGWLDTPLELLVVARQAAARRSAPDEHQEHWGRMSAVWIIAASLRSPRRSSAISSARCARRGARRSSATSSRQRARSSQSKPSCARAMPSYCVRARRRCARRSKAPRALALDANSETFLKLAREVFGRDQAEAASLAQGTRRSHRATRRAASSSRCANRKSRRRRSSASGANPRARLTGQIENLVKVQDLLQRETRNLSTALRRPEVRGRWGELTLRRVVELSGMSEHCDFNEQETRAARPSAARCVPTCWCACPSRASIVVDAKTPLDAYLDAVEAQDDETRRVALAPPRAAGGTARARARPEELLGTVRRQPGVRGAVPARRSVPVGGARRAPRPDRLRAQAEHHHHHAVDAHGVAQGRCLRLAADRGRRERARRSASSARTCTSASTTS